MKFSKQEEYGLRCLIRIAKFNLAERPLTIPEISEFEGISQHNAAKILRKLRMGGFLESERGQAGGYTLARSPEAIKIGNVLNALGGRLYDDSFCSSHTGIEDQCTNTIDCSVRSLWKRIQSSVDNVVNDLTLKELLGTESDIFNFENDSISHAN